LEDDPLFPFPELGHEFFIKKEANSDEFWIEEREEENFPFLSKFPGLHDQIKKIPKLKIPLFGSSDPLFVCFGYLIF
jgi:hypothetical protein